MDTFFEQIVKVKKTSKEWAKVCITLFFTVMLLSITGTFLFSNIAPLAFLAMCAVVWGAYKLIMTTSIEYEYIFTNGDLDFDKIIARSSRKRIVSVNTQKTERYGKYNPAAKKSDSVKKTYMLCDAKDPNAMFIVAPSKKEGTVMVVFAPDRRMQDAIEKFVPRAVR